MASKNQPDNIQGQLQQLGRTAGILANKLTGEFIKWVAGEFLTRAIIR